MASTRPRFAIRSLLLVMLMIALFLGGRASMRTAFLLQVAEKKMALAEMESMNAELMVLRSRAGSDQDFQNKDLRAADLDNRSLSSSHFDGSDLRRANLSCSALSSAHFAGADLRGADLRYSVLTDAFFTNADLRSADLSYSVLTDAWFHGAKLEGADLSYALLGGHFDGSTSYDSTTQFPEGFDPVASGLKLVQTSSD